MEVPEPSSSHHQSIMEYQKRSGTNGLEGKFYETKMIALVLLRLLHHERVADFCLATNMEGMGAFDDICVKVSLVGRERPLALFLQLKHKINDDASLTIHDSSSDLVKYVDSFVTISNKISSQKERDYFFDTSISKADSMFILYTNAEFKVTYSALHTESSLKRFVSGYDNLINEILGTEVSVGRALRHPEQFVRDFTKSKQEKEFAMLAERFAMFLCDKTKQAHIMNDECLQQYHVLLARHVVHIGEIQTDGCRKLSFRHEFFESQDEPIALFRGTLFEQIFNNLSRKKILSETSVETYLRKLKLKVPVGFGNVDMVWSGGPTKVERRLNYLVTGILKMCQRYEQLESFKVVTIDDTVDGGLLTHSGGLASGVGNVLTSDEITDTLKFADCFSPRQNNAEMLFNKLKQQSEQAENGIVHLSDYRFKVQTCKLPKLRFNCTDTARKFISKLVIYDKQSNQSKVEEVLKDEIQNLLYKRVHHSDLQPHSVFLHYHEEVVSWWMRPSGKYLNKASNLYELAIKNIKAEPQMSALHTTFHVNNSRYRGYGFDETTPKWSALIQLSAHMSIVTDTVTLTTMKAIECLRKLRATIKYTVFDMKNVTNLSTADFSSLQAELRKTDKVLIIVWRDTDSGAVSPTMLHELAQATERKQIIVVTSDVLVDKVHKYFPNVKVFKDKTQNFTLMTADSQKEWKKNCKIIFQGVALSLDLLMDDVSLLFIKGVVLDKLTRHEAIFLGTPLDDSRYEDIKHLYIDRNLRCVSDQPYESSEPCRITTFHDIADEVILLTAPPGMGKSIIITRLSINTKERDPTVWIVRVNFINHSKHFKEWCDDNKGVGAVEALEFLCRVATRNHSVSFSVQLTNDGASLGNCAGDGFITFELNMFLHYYNRQRLILVFDGFDEICPHYTDKVIDFLSVVKTRLKKSKMWVTSRPYSSILPRLQGALSSRGFEMEHLSYREQELFLKNFWREKCLNEKLSTQLARLEAFIENVGQPMFRVDEWVQFIYYNFVDFVGHMLSQCRHADIEAQLMSFRDRPVESTMSGIPLILYFIADYFVNIVDIDKKRIKNKLIIDLNDVYEMFVENKLKKILFQDKSNMELSNPITISLIEKELDDRIRVYKILAANALFQNSILREFGEFKDMTPLDHEELHTELKRIKIGADKTGLISHVTADNVAVFIHRSFTEYFAAGYACDILKKKLLKNSTKVLFYYALSNYVDIGVRYWIEAKQIIDESLANVLKEIEKPTLCTSNYFAYIDFDYLSEQQQTRVLASSMDDYENFNFTTFSDLLSTQISWNTIDRVTCRNLFVYLQGYMINQMKVHLRVHFADQALFLLKENNFNRSYSLVPNLEEMLDLCDICIKIEIVGHERAAPLLVRLEHKDDDDLTHFYDSDCESSGQIVLRVNNTCTSHMYILYKNEEFRKGSYKTYEPDSVRAIDTLMAITSTVRSRLQYSEQSVQEFANILLQKEISLFVQRFELILFPSFKSELTDPCVANTFCYTDYSCSPVFRYRYQNIFEKQCDLDNQPWHNLLFRDDFLDTDDPHTTLIRNYLVQEILHKPNFDVSGYLTCDELLKSFFSKPSTDTLTPLIGAFVVCCEEGELKFVNSRPADDVERLKQVDILQSAIHEALRTCRTAVIEYLRSLRMKVPADIAGVDLMICGKPINIVDYSVGAIIELCERCDRTDLYRVVTVDDVDGRTFFRYGGAFAEALYSVLTFDEQSNMFKFSNAHQFTVAQKNVKMLFKKLSANKNDLHEYRFRFKYNNFLKLHSELSDTVREFLDKLVIYGERGNHYRVENILGEKPRKRQYQITSQLKLLHYHTGTLQWWTLRNRRVDTRQLYRRAAHNVTTEPLISELHTKFHMSHIKYLDISDYQINFKYQEILKVPGRTLIETDAVIPRAIEVMQFLRNNDSINSFTILELNYVLDILSDTARLSLYAELRQTDKVLIVVWHTSQTARDDILDAFAEAIKDKNVIVVTENESVKYNWLLSTKRVFKCKTEL